MSKLEVEKAPVPTETVQKEDAAPVLTMINTMAKPDDGVQAATVAQEENKEEVDENYEQGALNYLSLAMQIITDFSSEDSAFKGEQSDRKKIMAFLEIDTLLSRVQLFNHAPDYQSALTDLKSVEDLCVQFPENNESTLTSAIFQMGRCAMELNLHE